MSIESDFFTKKAVKFDSLLPFGFKKEGADYSYQEIFMDGDFEAQITISSSGQVTGHVIDLDTKEEYLALRVERQLGNFLGQVRESYAELLGRISDSCFEPLPFINNQTTRLPQRIEKKNEKTYDYPFEKSPEIASYRNPSNQKWYGLIMVIAREKLDIGQEIWQKEDLQKKIEIINLKVKTSEMTKLLGHPGIYPSYHMSKKSWISLVLDDTVSDELLFSLVDTSRALTAGSSLANPNGQDYWIIPANLKYYDIDAEFANNKIIKWTQKASMKQGDYLTIYITAPTRALRYFCRILEVDIENDGYRNQKGIRKLMRIELLKTFDDKEFDISILKSHGVTNIRGPRRMTKELIDVIKKYTKRGN